MKRTMLTICLMVFLLPFAIVCGSEKAEEMSMAQKAFRQRLNGKSQQAKEMLSGYLKEHPNDAVAQFEYSRVLCYLFDLESAEKHAAKAVELDEDNPRYHCWQGLCGTYLFIDQAHHKGNPDQSILKRAVGELQRSVELKPDYHESRYLLVNLLNNNPPELGGNPKQARKHAKYLMETDLDYGLQAMMVVEGEKSLDWKIEQYQNALDKESDNDGLHAGIALLYAELGKMEKSQEHIDRALELNERQKGILLDIVFPLVRKNKYQSAIEMTERYLDLSDGDSAAMRAFGRFYLAKLEKMSGDPDSDKTLKQARQVDPDVWMTMKAPPEMLFEPLE